MHRPDLLLFTVTVVAICLIGGGGCSRWHSDDEDSNHGAQNPASGSERVRQTTLPRIGREPLTADEAEMLDGLDKRAMRLMRLGRKRNAWAGEADKRAMKLLRLGKKSSGGFYRPSFRYGK
ncbi:hypothetical protein BOX15_Mlig018224g1 [Macrostomum lignano]|uniref:Uncharacterized protein n=1 Tax=Macrostomum lignano TaxID=282301 RepID=A0A267F294_9PLAT|nr:hypothetical protein BOX15_Mlig018224g1 [Macrostomum lignano]